MLARLKNTFIVLKYTFIFTSQQLPNILFDSLFFQSLLCMMLICGDWSDCSHFHFIIPVMPDKAVFVSTVLRLLPGETTILLLQKPHLVAMNVFSFSFRPMRKDQQVGGQYANVSCWCQHKTAWDSFKNDSFRVSVRVDSFFCERQ